MNFLRRFLPLSLLATSLCGIIFVTGQQMLRISANDPQIQMAEDIAQQLSTANDTFQITTLPRINIGASLAPFVIIFDANGKILSSSGELDGKMPLLPDGVLAYTKEHDENRFTWQPKAGVRIASVVKHFSGRTTGYVLSGRSLREVEKQVDSLEKYVLVGWLGTQILMAVVLLITTEHSRKKK